MKAALANCRLQSAQLKTDEIIELFYEFYNPITSREEKISNLESLKILTKNESGERNEEGENGEVQK